MKKLILAIIIVLLPSLVLAADTKISAMTLKAAPVANDTGVIVDSVGGANKKFTLGTLPVSTATQSALNLLAPLSNPTFTGTVTGTFSGGLTGNVTGNCSGSSGSCTGNAATATLATSATSATTATTATSATSATSATTATSATSAAKWTTARNIAGNSVDGSAAVVFANKFILQGTADAGLSSAQFLGALDTGIIKNTATTGILSIASSGIDYAPATSGTNILKGDGAGGFASAGTAPSGTIVGTSDTQTLTNKRVTFRVGTATDAASLTPNSDSYDQVNLHSTQISGTLTINAPSGTPTDGQGLYLRILCDSAQTPSWSSSYRSPDTTPGALPTTSNSLAAGKEYYFNFRYNLGATKWDYVGKSGAF